MPEIPTNTKRIQFLLTSLGLLLILILTLVIVLAVYPYIFAPTPSPEPAQVSRLRSTPAPSLTPTTTLTPSPTRTLRPSFTPTISLTPTRTSTITPTSSPTGLPTLTPARPIGGEETYKIQSWNPDRANYLVSLMDYYPNTLPRQSRGDNDVNYYSAFEFATVAQREALLRYPEANYAGQWEWGLAYNMTLLGDPQAGQYYANLIAGALNREETQIGSIDEWFSIQESRLKLTTTNYPAPPGYVNSYLMEIQGKGSAFILILESLGNYQAVTLTSDFDYLQDQQFAAIQGDLNGDGIAEIIIYKVQSPESSVVEPPKVFNLEQLPPTLLPYNPKTSSIDLGPVITGQWEIQENSSGGNELRFRAELFPACPVTYHLSFKWNGDWLETQQNEFELAPNPATLAYCEETIIHSTNYWGLRTTVTLMETLSPLWPPMETVDGSRYPEDAIDEWRYRLGIFQAMLNNRDQAIAYLDEIVKTPSSPSSRWIALSQEFLQIYKSGDDLYRACLVSEYCDPADAFQALVESLPRNDYPNILAKLWQYGINQRASGYFDFDGDGVKEIWLTLRHRAGERLEFWILIPYPQGIKAFSLGPMDTNLPLVSYYDDELLPPIVLLEGTTAFQVHRLPTNLEPYLTTPELPKFYPDRFKEGLQAAIEALYSGQSPASVYKSLQELEIYPGLLCKGTWSCDSYYYFLGLSAELAGDQSGAINTYLRLWWDYSRSPYTTMARLKLRGPAVLPSATPSPTLMPTNTQTSTPTITGTPPTATLTPTATNTNTAYPTP